VKYDDDSAQECFRKYEQPMESYNDHSLFLTSRSRYASLFNLQKNDYKGWANGLKAAGYATDVKYPSKLIGIIERYQLHQYDSEVLGSDYVAQNPKQAIVLNQSQSEYVVTAGDTLYSIAKKFNLTVDELRSKNNLSDNAIAIGQNLKVN
jgi:LysM repeat protein